MVKEKDSVIKTVKKYLREVRNSGIRIKKAYLYGSYAGSKSQEDSDIDVAIISPDFSGNRFNDALKLKSLRWKIDLRIEPMPILPEDFTEDNPIVYEILKKGIPVK